MSRSALTIQRLTGRLLRNVASIGAPILIGGCSLARAPIVDPKGPVALAERDLLITAALTMLIVIVPVFILTAVFSWRYRSKGGRGRYRPEWTYSAPIDAAVWGVPAIIVLVLGTLLWEATHRLDPYRRLDPSLDALEVEVVAQDWKWLFIYPASGIASVNELVFPAGQPLSLKITSDTVMNSFFIPALGGQIYAMAGMQTRLNLMADAPGRFMGRNTQYSGDGFADQHFVAIATTQADFETWVEKVRQSASSLDASAYSDLASPSIAHPVSYYSSVEAGLFASIIANYAAGHVPSGHADPSSEVSH